MPKLGEQCEHGSLKRQCLVCELQEENAELKEALRKIAGIASPYMRCLIDAAEKIVEKASHAK